MKINEFGLEIDRLKSVYGANKYPPERVAILFRHFSSLDVQYFASKVDLLIATSDKAPMLNDFLAIMQDKQTLMAKQVVLCDKCYGTGRIIKEIEGYSTAFRCSCENGKPYSYLRIINGN